MADLPPLSGLPPAAANIYRPPAVATAAEQPAPAAPEPEKPKTEAAKPARLTDVSGFNPSAKIDPDTHIVVLTVKGPDGQTVRQIPTERQIAAYKAEESQVRRP